MFFVTAHCLGGKICFKGQKNPLKAGVCIKSTNLPKPISTEKIPAMKILRIPLFESYTSQNRSFGTGGGLSAPFLACFEWLASARSFLEKLCLEGKKNPRAAGKSWASASVLFLLLVPMALLAQQPPGVSRVDPPHWWAGMETVRTLELMVNHPGIADYKPTLEHPTVKIKKYSQGESRNYLFVELEIPENTKPGSLNIIFSHNGNKRYCSYNLLPRKKDKNSVQGISTGDVMYLLFPDRFANGDVANDTVPGMKETGLNRKEMYARHGGDLQGAINKLDYLKDLGITAIWLNPVFENDMPKTSYHGYAITDFYRVDHRLGINNDYKRLVEEAHAKGMKIVKDVIYNHVGNECYFFKDQPERSWFNNWAEFTRTNYREAIFFDPYASEADTRRMTNGWFDTHMPDLNQQNPHLAKYLIQASLWWVEEYGIDGYRVDTWIYPDQKFMNDLCTALLAEYPKLCIFGETWVHGVSTQSYFMENNINAPFKSALPGVTDFQLHYAINDAVTKEQGWTDGVSKLYYTLAKDFLYKNPYKNVTFLDNHDLSRFYSVVGESPAKYKQGIGLLMTMRGTPCIYYGTEILMKNFTNPDGLVREDFPGGWTGDPADKFTEAGRTPLENECWNFFRTLAKYRHATTALQEGKLMQFIPEDGVYVYFRYDVTKTVMVVLNSAAQERTINLNRFAERTNPFKQGKDVLTGETAITDLRDAQFKVKGTSIGIYELY